MKKIVLSLIVSASAAGADPFAREDSCYRFLSAVHQANEVFFTSINDNVDVTSLSEGDEMFSALQKTGQSLVDLRRLVSDMCSEMKPNP